MLNHIVIMGRLTRDPELRRTGSGIAVASFTLAVDRDYSPRDGGERETDFIDCVAWRQTGEFVSKYFTKGRMAVVSGRLQIRSWTDKDGNKRRTATGLAVTSFSVAVDRDFGKSDNGEKKTDFFDCVAWRNTAEFASKYLSKGRMVVVSGRLEFRDWNDKEGNKRRSAEIIVDNVYFADSRRDNEGGNAYGGNSYGNTGYGAPAYNAPAPSYGGYSAPAAPASDFAMLEDDDAQLPF